MTRRDDVRRNPVRLFFCWAGGSKDVKRWSHFFSLSRFCSVLAFAPVRFLMIGRMESDRASKTVVRPLQSGHSYADEADPIAKGVGRGYFDGDNKRTASCSRPVIKRFPTIRLSLSLSVAGHIKRKEKNIKDTPKSMEILGCRDSGDVDPFGGCRISKDPSRERRRRILEPNERFWLPDPIASVLFSSHSTDTPREIDFLCSRR